MTTCDRCSTETRVTIMSKFNRDVLCMPCNKDEKEAPGFAAARKVEFQAVRAGDYNFAGVGLSPEAARFLSEKRGLRK